MKQKSFTLIELLVVIAIVGLFSSITLVAVKNVREKARIASGLQFSASVKSALGDEMVGEWLFEETGNNYNDTSGNNNSCSSVGDYHGHPSDTPSQFGETLNFFTAARFLNCGSKDSLNITGDTITIAVWIFPTTLDAGLRYIITKSANYRLAYNYLDSNVFLYLNGILVGSSDINAVPFNKWSHIVVSYNKNASSNQIKFYVNGKEAGVNTYTITLSGVLTDILYIGSSGGISSFRGYIEGVRIYKSSLTSAQIQKLYAEGAEKRGLLVAN